MADINGNNRANDIVGTRNDDRIRARGGNDEVDGRRGDDLINGDDGNDDLKGGRGNDEVRGGDGNDKVKGGGGNDVLYGGIGDDVLTGGSGFDEFNFRVSPTSSAGKDKISDFDETTEVINLGTFGSFANLDTNGDGDLTSADTWVTRNGNITVIDVGAAFGFAPDTEVLTVFNVINSPLDTNDFIFTA